MLTTKQTGAGSKGSSKTTNVPRYNPSSHEGKQDKDLQGTQRLDFEDVQEQWTTIIDRQREELETDVLQITKPRAKLDQIVKEVLDGLLARLICRDSDSEHSPPEGKLRVYPSKVGGKEWEALKKGLPQLDYERGKKGGDGSSVTTKTLEKHVRAFIVEKGIASEVKKVTQRLNSRRMTDGRRWVLSETYVWLLNNLFQGKSVKRGKSIKQDKNANEDKNAKIDTLVQDDLGVADKIMLDLEAEEGPLDTFTQLLVKEVMERNRIRIGQGKTLLLLVAQQVRSVI